jgi:hypothetical protein
MGKIRRESWLTPFIHLPSDKRHILNMQYLHLDQHWAIPSAEATPSFTVDRSTSKMLDRFDHGALSVKG